MDLKRRTFNRRLRLLSRPFPATTFDDRMRVLRAEIDDYLGDLPQVERARKHRGNAVNRMETGGVDRAEA